jgi:hypothetical protein
MKFIVTWTVPQGTFNAAVARFLETGGAPPEGVKMLGRWHGMAWTVRDLRFLNRLIQRPCIVGSPNGPTFSR